MSFAEWFDESFIPDKSDYCEECQRYYNPKTPHVCYPSDINVEAERRKVKRFLGEYDLDE